MKQKLCALLLAIGIGCLLFLGQPANAARQSDVIEGQYIVVFKQAEVFAQSSQEVSSAMAKKYGVSTKRVLNSALRGMVIKADAAAAQQIAKDSRVAYVEQDAKVHAQAIQYSPPSWGLDRIGQRNLPLDKMYGYPTNTAKITTYVIDTGISVSHQDFGGRAKSGYDFIDEDATANDCNGHGTHVAGTIGGTNYGGAKNVTLIGVKVLGCEGDGSVSSVVAGIDWVTKNAKKPAVANISLDGPRSRAMNDALQRSVAAGITYAVAAGNENDDACQYSPASADAAITVGATDENDARAWFSDYGSCVDIFAPGQDITSAWIGGASEKATISGTSMATPHVTAAAAMVLADHPTFTPEQVRATIVNMASKDIVTNLDSTFTLSPNRLVFTGEPTVLQKPATYCSKSFTASPQKQIPDMGADQTTYPIESGLTASGCAGKGSYFAKITVDISHKDAGDLHIQLQAPSGKKFNLKEADWLGTQNSPFTATTYYVNLSAETANGSWKLIVTDEAEVYSGVLKQWTLKL